MAVLLRVMVTKTISCSSLSDSIKAKDKTFAETVKILQNYLAPKSLAIAKHFCFQRENQENEMFSEYGTVLKQLNESCQFVGSLNDALEWLASVM